MLIETVQWALVTGALYHLMDRYLNQIWTEIKEIQSTQADTIQVLQQQVAELQRKTDYLDED